MLGFINRRVIIDFVARANTEINGRLTVNDRQHKLAIKLEPLQVRKNLAVRLQQFGELRIGVHSLGINIMKMSRNYYLQLKSSYIKLIKSTWNIKIDAFFAKMSKSRIFIAKDLKLGQKCRHQIFLNLIRTV